MLHRTSAIFSKATSLSNSNPWTGLYLNGYIAHLQHGAGLVRFLSQQRGNPIASPGLLGQLTGQFVAKVRDFALKHQIPLFAFRPQESKDQRAHPAPLNTR
jgi:hypothetical protein